MPTVLPHGVADLVTLAADSRPDHLAVIEAGGRGLTWAELDSEVDRVAGGLVGAGVVAGTRVLLSLGNRVELVAAYLAVLRAQAVAVPVNPDADQRELGTLLADSGSRYALGDERSVAALRGAVAELETPVTLVLVGKPCAGELAYDDLRGGRHLPPLLDPERLAVLLYTSGTSGPPRAAMLTHRALVANLEQVAALDPPLIGPDDVVLGVLPLFHAYGLAAVLGGVVRQAATLLLVAKFDADAVLDLVAAHGGTVLPVAPVALERWLEIGGLADRLGTTHTVLSGSAPLGRSLLEAFREATGVTVHQGYGLTEACPVVTSTAGTTAAGTLGVPVPGVELRVVDVQGGPVLVGDPGEIEVRGPNLFSGYWPDGSDGPAEDGWWPTGDLGVRDADGALILVDRVHETITVEGFPVYPHEVEDVLRGVAGVAEAAVIGVPDQTGPKIVAYVVAPGADPAELVAAVHEWCRTQLAAFKRPDRVEVVSRLPLSVTGRVQKGRLRHLERRRGLGLLS